MGSKNCFLIVSFALAFLITGFSSVGAQNVDAKSNSDSSARSRADRSLDIANMDEARKEELKQFVITHHPELEKLLGRLQDARPAKYKAAVRSLARNYDRLEHLKGRNSERYEIALEQWKLRSRIQLLAAHIAIKDSPQKRKQLRKLIETQTKMRVRALEADKANAEERLKRLNAQLSEMKSNRDKIVDRQFDATLKSMNRVKSGSKRKGKSSASTNSDK